jgi:transcription antitermination factor NusG
MYAEGTERLMPWRVVQTQRHKERVAGARLAQCGLENYVPLLRQWPRPVVGSEVGPMFPGYIFVRSATEDFHRVMRTPGVRAFVAFRDGDPASLDDSVIAFLRSREQADGVISAEPLPSGSAIAITDGPLRGVVAVLERRLTGRQRVLVLLEILQRETRVELPDRWVRLA